MASVQNDNAPAPPLKSPPTTADSKPVARQPDANANTFSGGAESQVRRGNPPKRRTPVEARKSKYRGVQWDKNGARWRARLHTDRTRHIGYFESEEDAAMAWDLALLRYFGEKEGRKKLNFGEASIERYRQEPNAQLQAINSRTAGTKQYFRGPIDQHGNPQDPNGAAVPAYRGVVPHEGGVFKSVLMKNRLNETVGFYASAEEAARAHDCASIQANGWGALTNFPLADYETDPQGNIIVRLPINQPISLQKISLADQQQASQMAGGNPMSGGGGGGLPRSNSWYGSIPTNSTGGLGTNGTNGLPPLHRQASLPANVLAHPGGVAYTSPGATAAVAFQQQQQQRILRSTSLSSADLSMQPSMLAGGHLYNHQQQQQLQHQRTGSVTNLHQLAAAAIAGFNNTQQQQQQQQQVMMTTTAPIPHTPVYLMNQPGGIVYPFPAIEAQQQQQQQQQTMPMPSAPPPASAPNSSEQKKRSRAEIEDPSDAPTNSKSTGGRPSPFATNQNNNNEINNAAAAAAAAGAGASPNNNNYNHPPPSNNTNTTTATNPPTSASLPLEAAVAGVRHVPETGQYKAALYLDLGTFGSYDEAVRAYDRAALMSSGFSAKTHVPLLDAVNRAATAIGGGPPQLLPAGVAGASLRYRGVILRGGSFLASLDIGGKAYELGPFATELDAAKAFDRYSLLLKGVTAVTNFPPWEHLASATEVGAIIDAVGVVAMTSGDNGKNSGGTAPGQTVNQPSQPQQQQQQQPLVNVGGGGAGRGLINGGGSGLLTHSNSGAHLVGAGQPLLAPMINASSDLERLQLQLNELQQQALMQQQQMQQQIQQQHVQQQHQQQFQQQHQHVVHQEQQEQQQQQPLLMYTQPGQSTVPLHQVINTNTLPMVRVMSAQTLHMPTTQHQQHPAALASFPSAGNLGLVAPTPVPSLPPPPQQQQHQQQQQQQNIPTTIQLQMPTSAGMTPPPTTLNHHQQHQQQPAATTAGSSPPIPDQPQQQQHPVSAAVGALAAAAELGQELATAPVSASMPLSALQQPQTAAQAAAQSHDQGMLTRTHSMAVIAAAAVANAQATTSNAAVGNLTPHGALTQDTTGAGNAGGAACISTGAAAAVAGGGGGGGVVGHLTPPASAFDTGTLSGQPDIGTIDFSNQQPPAGAHGGPLRTASMAAAEATLAADAAAEFVATATVTDPPT